MSDGKGDQPDRGEAVLAIFHRGAEFTRELLAENERLRGRINAIETRQHEAAQSPGDWEKLRHELIHRIEDLEAENRDIMEQLRSVESENKQFADRYLEIEEENNNLANLYVASYQLHSTLDPSEVLRVIVEIVINLIGAEVFCVYVCPEDSKQLEPVAAEGADLDLFPELEIGRGPVGEAVESGTVVCREAESGVSGPEAATSVPIVSIPLRVDGLPVGAIAVHSLLQQKSGFSALDHELFTLLAGHAATAIFASRLYAQSERKLTTIQGFIDLLTK
jgi:nitrate/nitrite-specific signal transduction histidine kinase